MSQASVAQFWAALSTSTTVFNPHRGVALPAARLVIVVIPTVAILFYVLVVRRKR